MTRIEFQIKTRDMVEVLKEDMNRLKKMYQPSMVSEQLQELYKEMDEKGEVNSKCVTSFFEFWINLKFLESTTIVG